MTPSDELREKVARVIDAEAWCTEADWLARIEAVPGKGDTPDGNKRCARNNYVNREGNRRTALAKADRILALPELSAGTISVPVVEGFRARIAELEAGLRPFDLLSAVGVPDAVWPDDKPHWRARDHNWGKRIKVEHILRAASLLKERDDG